MSVVTDEKNGEVRVNEKNIIEKMDKTWRLILGPKESSSSTGEVGGFSNLSSADGALKEKCKICSIKEGAGFSMFKFLRMSESKDPVCESAEFKDSGDRYNCIFCYIEKDSAHWNLITSTSPKSVEFFKIYIPRDHFVICVEIPEHEIGDSNYLEIKIFSLIDGKEVAF